jgi:hypothetical protein
MPELRRELGLFLKKQGRTAGWPTILSRRHESKMHDDRLKSALDCCTQTPPHIERYRQLRATGKRLISKLYAAARGALYDSVKAAKKLTMPVYGRTIVFDGETDMNALADFFLHEMRFGGKRIADVLAESGVDLPPDERQLLAAHRASRCSLFQVIGVNPSACQLSLRDVLEPGPSDVVLTDISLSNCGAVTPGSLIFTRIVHCDGFYISAGFFFGFRASQRVALLNAYQAMATVPASGRR